MLTVAGRFAFACVSNVNLYKDPQGFIENGQSQQIEAALHVM